MPNTALIERLQTNLTVAIEAREGHTKEMTDILDAVKADEARTEKKLTVDESTRFDAIEAKRAEESGKVNEISARIAELAGEDQRDAASAEVIRGFGLGAGDGVTNEKRDVRGGFTAKGKDTVYTKDGKHSYFRDLMLVTPGIGQSEGSYEAQQRLNAHAEMLDRVGDEIPEMFRSGPSKRMAGSGIGGGQEQRVTPSRVDGNGGYFVPPLWKIDEWIPYLRAGRTVANLFDNMDLPTGTDSINIPKLTLGTLVGVQADNGAVPSQDITDNFVTGPVRTLAGQEDIPMQLLEQSPIGPSFDKIIGKDLLSSYNQQVDIQCITGTGTGLQMKGLSNISGLNAVTFTSGSPTAALLYPILGQAASQVARQRFAMPTAFAVTPQRWFWLVTQVDTAGRPLVLPKGQPGFNAMGSYDGTAEGLAGEIFGIPIYVDANIPSTVSTNQDTIYAAKFDDLYLFEGAPRVRTLMEVLSGTLQVRVQLYNYCATIVDRFPVSVSAINGTGLVSPSGF